MVINNVSHLLLQMILSSPEQGSLQEINAILRNLSLNAWLSVNKGKSKVFFRKTCHNKEELRSLLDIHEGAFPTKYLGLPFSINYPKARNYSSLIDKCKSKLEGWSSYTLSFAGRVQLVRSVIQRYLIYWVQSYKFPLLVTNSWKVDG